jgi:hypothetical protein
MYCICCKKNKITPYDPIMDGQLGEYKTEEELLWRDEVKNNRSITIDNEMVNDGIIQTIGAGYGSIHDTDTFIIAICDECITENLEDGTLLLFRSGDYIDGDKHIENSKKAWRRRTRLDGLVGEE